MVWSTDLEYRIKMPDTFQQQEYPADGYNASCGENIWVGRVRNQLLTRFDCTMIILRMMLHSICTRHFPALSVLWSKSRMNISKNWMRIATCPTFRKLYYMATSIKLSKHQESPNADSYPEPSHLPDCLVCPGRTQTVRYPISTCNGK
jgi:hypothetical protein